MPHNLDQDRDRPRRPAIEPEILPPGRPDPRPDPRRPRGRARESAQIWASVDTVGGQRIFIAKPSPFAFILALLGAGAAVTIVLLLLFSLLVVWLPILGAIVAGVILLRAFSGPKRRLP